MADRKKWVFYVIHKQALFLLFSCYFKWGKRRFWNVVIDDRNVDYIIESVKSLCASRVKLCFFFFLPYCSAIIGIV
ncbi:hypothetical protein BX661DRAFT_189456 [Kickxella alabastrina]|uniref:uncharacterized protein n=1 Tax=Kickxella alabastrina TaxID=61397 RepID=UPI002220DCC9|nr:uncharacterized protein BX661DRAFT_189456 [Kickxella alabastrina]KAI7820205.1 hypothetical protein BX661DRAFT_189456 [Kickxella alabastrina]